ncbi:hypothetical protein Tco_0512088 [Tanacetum coccineum]
MKSAALFAHIDATVEPENKQEIVEQRLDRYEFLRPTITTEDNCVGNCLLKAVSCHCYGGDHYPQKVRRAGVARLILYRHLYENRRHIYQSELWLQLSWDEYIEKVSRVNEDVDDLFTFAICDAYRVRIMQLRSDEEFCIVEYIPYNKNVTKTIGIVTCGVQTDPMYRRFQIEDQGDSDED